MKKIIGKRVEEEVLRCEICKKVIGKSMWRAFVDGIIIEDGDCEGLDFCSKKCSMKWIKENVMTEKIKTSQVKGYKQKGCEFMGFEINKEYCDVASKRLQQEVLI